MIVDRFLKINFHPVSRFKKRIKFKTVRPILDFQSDPHDVMCQTWIWFWIYNRTVRKCSHKKIVAEVSKMIEQKKSLHIIHLFSSWLCDLGKLGFFDKATDSQARIAEENSPKIKKIIYSV